MAAAARTNFAMLSRSFKQGISRESSFIRSECAFVRFYASKKGEFKDIYFFLKEYEVGTVTGIGTDWQTRLKRANLNI